ncbi:hypothetical protein B0T16DRAFT_317017, partial [Cercophora newfieldiana]
THSQLIMTPIIFISFIVSLSLVDMRHSAQRSHYHAADSQTHGRMPQWLHRLVYRYQPYRHVPVDEKGRSIGEAVDNRQYYHSHQRKLMRMEVAEAFEIRSGVLVVLGLVSLGVVWGVWKVLSWIVGFMS